MLVFFLSFARSAPPPSRPAITHNPQSADSMEISAARTLAESSQRAIHESSQAEVARVLASWGVLAEEAVGAARGEAAEAASALGARLARDAEGHAEEARARAKAAAGSLAEQAAADFDARLAPLLARLDGQCAASGAAARQLGAARERLVALLAAVRRGEDTGEDVSEFVGAFPLLPRGSGGGGESVASWGGGGARGGGGGGVSVAHLEQAPALLEARDAAAMGLSSAGAREQLGALMDSVSAQWAAQGGRGVEDVSAFMAELLAVAHSDTAVKEGAREAERLGVTG